MRFNKGEWSEIYTFLYLIDNPHLVIVDEKLQALDDTTFQILGFLSENTKYSLDDNKIIKISPSGNSKEYYISGISIYHKILLNKVIAHRGGSGAFEIDEMQVLINDLLDGKKLKGSSKSKVDLEAIVFDSISNNNFKISYNIKSNLGAVLLY